MTGKRIVPNCVKYKSTKVYEACWKKDDDCPFLDDPHDCTIPRLLEIYPEFKKILEDELSKK